MRTFRDVAGRWWRVQGLGTDALCMVVRVCVWVWRPLEHGGARMCVALEASGAYGTGGKVEAVPTMRLKSTSSHRSVEAYAAMDVGPFVSAGRCVEVASCPVVEVAA